MVALRFQRVDTRLIIQSLISDAAPKRRLINERVLPKNKKDKDSLWAAFHILVRPYSCTQCSHFNPQLEKPHR